MKPITDKQLRKVIKRRREKGLSVDRQCHLLRKRNAGTTSHVVCEETKRSDGKTEITAFVRR